LKYHVVQSVVTIWSQEENGMDLVAEIRQEEEAIASIDAEFPQAAEAIRVAVTSFAQRWMTEQVERQVKGAGSERTKQLGKDGVQKVKSDLQALIADVPARVRENFGHLDRLLEIPERSDAHPSGGKPFEEPVRIVLGGAGSLLSKYGYATIGDGSEWQLASGGPHVRYATNLNRDENVESALKSYFAIGKERRVHEAKLEALRARLSASEATALWDEV
jgi:hypothetical protein